MTIIKTIYISILEIFKLFGSNPVFTTSFNDQKNNGALILAVKAPKDEVLNIVVNNNHTNSVNNAHGQLKNNKIPAAVAIPFPPLNNRKGLNICPNIDNNATLNKRVVNNSSAIIGLKFI